MRRIAEADEPCPIPSPQEIHFDGQQFHPVRAVDFSEPATEERGEPLDATAEIVETGLLEFAGSAFLNHIGALPIFVAIEHDQHPPAFHPTKRFT